MKSKRRPRAGSTRVVARAATGAALLASIAALGLHEPSGSTALAAGIDGRSVYATHCARCHGTEGQGAERAGPPLASNSFVTANAKNVIHTVAYGMTGPIKFNGRPWGSGTMPAWNRVLNRAQIAAVITYVRGSWGNKASAVSEKQVLSDK